MSDVISMNPNHLLEFINLFEDTYKSSDTQKINTSNKILEQKLSEPKSSIKTLLYILSFDSILDKQITLELQKSILTRLKYILTKYFKKFNSEEIFLYIKSILDLIYKNKKLNNNSIISIILEILTSLLTSLHTMTNKTYIIFLFELILANLNKSNINNFLYEAKISIIISTKIMETYNLDNNNYEKLIYNYYLPIINLVFKNVKYFLDPKNNLFNTEYIIILKYIFTGFCSIGKSIKRFLSNERTQNIFASFYKEYSVYAYELLQITIPLDEISLKQYGNPNPLVSISSDKQKADELNIMKAKIFEFFYLFLKIYMAIDDNNDININNGDIDINEIIDLTNKIVILVMNSIQNILSSKEKFLALRKQDYREFNSSCIYLFFEALIFLSISLFIPNIKQEFKKYIKDFILNMILPIIITIDQYEKELLELQPEIYQQYLDNLLIIFKEKSLRTSACYLLLKICEGYEDITNFCLFFSLEMMDYIFNEEQIMNKYDENIMYIQRLKESNLNQFNDKDKFDLGLLIILLLKDKFNFNNTYLKMKIRTVLMNNQEKMHSIEDPIIKIKLCRMYNYFLSILISEQDYEHKISPEIKIIFIETGINFLLNNIVQNGKEKSDEYIHPLGKEASEAIMAIINSENKEQYKENESLVKYINSRLENYFSVFIQLINFIDGFSFYLIIEKIINEIKIEQRNLIFECLNGLHIKFKNYYMNNEEKKYELYPKIFFQILIKFLKGINRLNNLNNNEIIEFNKILEKLMKDILTKKYSEYYDELISLTQEYVKALNSINYLSIKILKFIIKIIKQDKCTSFACYNFVSTFLSFMRNKVPENINQINENELFDEIFLIIKKSYSFSDEYFLSSKFYALLLTLQVLNMNTNINPQTLNLLLNSSIDCFILSPSIDEISTIEKTEEEENENIYPLEEIYCINQLCIANISLGFIYKPELTSEILINKFDDINKQTNLDKFIFYISYYKDIKYPVYNPLLGKCLILGICNILLNENFKNILDKSKEKKIFLLKFLLELIKKSKEEKYLIVRNIVKGELRTNFIEESNIDNEENEIEEENFNEKIEDFNANVDRALRGSNNIIINCDEFKYFKRVMKYIKENDNMIYNLIVKDCSNGEKNIIEEIGKLKNIKIFYKNKEYIVPRKIVKIKRKIIN